MSSVPLLFWYQLLVSKVKIKLWDTERQNLWLNNSAIPKYLFWLSFDLMPLNSKCLWMAHNTPNNILSNNKQQNTKLEQKKTKNKMVNMADSPKHSANI